MIVCFVPDLLLRSKIDVAIRHYGADVRHASSAQGLLAAAGDASAILVLIDLDAPGSGGAESVAAVRTATKARIVGFCSHVETDLIRESRRAGADTVMANSTFAAAVAGLVAEAAAIAPGGD